MPYEIVKAANGDVAIEVETGGETKQFSAREFSDDLRETEGGCGDPTQ